MLNKLMSEDNGKTFYRFANADGKVWIMPAGNMRVAMNLYQPSGRKGKILKRFFPLLHRIDFVRRAIKAEQIQCQLNAEIKQLFYSLYGVEDMQFSVFCGTPCVHQKITIQLSDGNKILGYAKASDNEEIALLFQEEAKKLEALWEYGVRGIPKCMFCDTLTNGVHLFVQSTSKTGHSKVLHEWNILHENFIEELNARTLRNLRFEESDYFATLQQLGEHLDWLPRNVKKDCLVDIMNKTMQAYQGKQMKFAAYHADFTPWNMFAENGKLFVFDWEYAKMTYPQGLDRYHFLTQTAVFEKYWEASQIIAYMQSDKGKWMDKASYSLYLLDVISRFTIREKGNVNGDVAKSFQIWMDLLQSMNQ